MGKKYDITFIGGKIELNKIWLEPNEVGYFNPCPLNWTQPVAGRDSEFYSSTAWGEMSNVSKVFIYLSQYLLIIFVEMYPLPNYLKKNPKHQNQNLILPL